MLTINRTKEATTTMPSLRSPEDLSERLGLRPTTYQRELMQRFYEDEDPLEVTEVPSQRTTEALAVAALWRLLREEGSKVVVIAANRDLESRFMGFVHQITTSIDPALSSVCRWTGNKAMKVGDSAGHELRFVSNRPEWLQGLCGAITFVVLGARSDEPHFYETMKVVDSYRNREGARHIVMW